LLDDPDPVVRGAVLDRLSEFGPDATIELRDIVEGRGPYDSDVREAAVDFLQEIGTQEMLRGLESAFGTSRSVDNASGESITHRTFDLERGAFAVARHRYPDLNLAYYRSQLNTIADIVRWRTRDFDSGMEVIRELNYYLVKQQRWRGVSRERYVDPDSSCLNKVIDLRRGLPITMSVVWLLIARRLELPLRGVSFPIHFLVRYQDENEDFIIDPFNGGGVVTESQCRTFVKSVGVDFHPAFLTPVNATHIVARMLRNLAEIYGDDEPRLAEGMREGIKLVTQEDSPFRL
jgi:regulator of sirC expression with transglutaminase-like and TPR domain